MHGGVDQDRVDGDARLGVRAEPAVARLHFQRAFDSLAADAVERADHLEERPVEHVPPQVFDGGMAGLLFGELEWNRLGRLGIAIREHNDRFRCGLVRSVAQERVAQIADIGLHFDEARFRHRRIPDSRELRASSAAGSNGSQRIEADVADRDDHFARREHRRGLGHRFQAEGHRQDGQAVLAGIDPTDAAAAERVVVGVEVFALVHDAAKDDRPTRFVMLDRLDQREGLLVRLARFASRESGTAKDSSESPFAEAKPAEKRLHHLALHVEELFHRREVRHAMIGADGPRLAVESRRLRRPASVRRREAPVPAGRDARPVARPGD